MAHDGGVDVQASDVVPPVHGEHLEAATRTGHDRDVEGAGAEVVYHDDRADRHLAAEHVGEVRGRRHRLLDQAYVRPPRLGRGRDQYSAPGGTPAGRTGQRDRVDGRIAGGPPRLLGDPGQDGRD